ncbi:alpha/beta hydrolase [Periweissella cryptocerci]|uniref:Alpha/beta hydrolase n=1 Tax=Periweissella cryptocerci TaxID=2506420 RepID=A0A4P6YVT5_9LACO|nr:alpha/beta hydrolase [Periweissella cryptocerci]QBO36918.1 alpha/beta hydrolase [Periweissella cryptocerci]
MIRTEKNIAYGPLDQQTLDVYVPDKPNGAAILDLHGGGWWQGDKAKEAKIATILADAGYLVVAANYRLATATENHYPTQVDDVKLANEWLISSAYDFDRKRLGYFGGSTGGNLATELGLATGRPFVSWSGLLDLAGFYNTHLELVPKQLVIGKSVPSDQIDQDGANDAYYKWIIINLLGDQVSPEKLVAATLYQRISKQSGPGLLANSMHEIVPAYEHQKVAQLLQEADVPVETILLAGNRHAEAYQEDALPATLAFLKRYLLA